MENHLLPDVAVGDFDSLSPRGEEFLKDLSTVEVIRLKPEKDDSGYPVCCESGYPQGTKRIEILGGNRPEGGSSDCKSGASCSHQKNGVSLALVDQYNYMTLAENGKVLEKSGQFGKYVSFFCRRRSCDRTLPWKALNTPLAWSSSAVSPGLWADCQQ